MLAVGTAVFHARSAVFACMSCWTSVWAAEPARSTLTSISLRYWWRIVSVLWLHEAFRVRMISCPTLYVVMA